MSTKEQKIQGRKFRLPALCFLNLSAHFYVWVTVWVRQLTHILTHTVSAKKVRKIPEIKRFQGFSVRWLQSGYFCLSPESESCGANPIRKIRNFLSD